ncbi:Hypothetical predicted protein [Cloeon dipterum]|uniref:C3H1-type domain-containing protein n=1 Tax=Cloeon dipterum TaxID=197152 RepID=A0A8S1CC80_9INSE|nr:Hypothetical predicted protein [Cloeon dipterum]
MALVGDLINLSDDNDHLLVRDLEDGTDADLSIVAAACTTADSEQQTGRNFIGEVRHVDSIECIYVASEAQIALFERLSMTYKSIWEFKSNVTIEPGDVVTFEIDDSFVRAKIQNVYEEYFTSDALLEVYLIDYGEIYMTERSKCVKLTPASLNEPEPCVHKVKLRIPFMHDLGQATRCRMQSMLKETLKVGDKVKVQYHKEINTSDLSDEQDLVRITKISGNLVVNEILLTLLKPAQFMEVLRSTTWCSIADSMDEDNLNKTISGYDPKDETRACKLYQNMGFCDRKNCRKEHGTLDPDGWTNDREEVYCGTYDVQNHLKFSPGSYLVISVTATVRSSTTCFYGHILNALNGAQNNWHELILQLSNQSKLQIFELLPALGELVIAKSNDRFFRARVIDIIDDEIPPKATVFCVDYGFEREINFDQIWKMLPELLHSPFQAVQFLVRNFGFPITEGKTIDAVCESIDFEHAVLIKVLRVYQNE